MKKLIQKINKNAIVRNLVLALCLFVVFISILSVSLNVFTRHNDYIIVPKFEGLSLTEAKDLAASKSLVLEVNDSVYVKGIAGGTILDQNPKSNREVKAGRHIFLTTNSFNKTMVKVPYVTGFSLRQAKNNLQMVGLGIAELIYRDDIATNNILEQLYKGRVITESSNRMVELGSEITLIVGRSEPDAVCTIPNILGLTLSEAKSRLWEVGLNVGATQFDSDVDIEFINRAKVYLQSPTPGLVKSLGTSISFDLTLDAEKVSKGEASAKRELKEIELLRRESEESEKQEVEIN